MAAKKKTVAPPSRARKAEQETVSQGESPPTSSPVSSARDASKQGTREALLRAGMEMFAEQGLDVPSLDALCARAGFTRGAFYVHFEDREQFIVAVMESATSRFLDAVLSTPGRTLDLRDVASAFSASVAGGSFPIFGDVPVHQFLAACARFPALRARYVTILLEAGARLAEAIRAGQRGGTVRTDLDPELVAGLLVVMALGVGTVTAIDVPFDAPAHLGALLGLLAPR